MENENNQQQLLEASKILFLKGASKKNIVDFLVEKGMTEDDAMQMSTDAYLSVREQVMANEELKRQQQSGELSEGGGGIPSWAIYIGILVLINIISAVFGLGFWIY